MILRSFVPSDTEALAKVYRDAVRGIGPQAYSAEQVAAWASYPDNLAEFRDRMSHGLTLVTEEASRVIAFGQLEPDDHLAFFTVRPRTLAGASDPRSMRRSKRTRCRAAYQRSARRPAG